MMMPRITVPSVIRPPSRNLSHIPRTVPRRPSARPSPNGLARRTTPSNIETRSPGQWVSGEVGGHQGPEVGGLERLAHEAVDAAGDGLVAAAVVHGEGQDGDPRQGGLAPEL